jgi:hypothetical protein
MRLRRGDFVVAMTLVWERNRQTRNIENARTAIRKTWVPQFASTTRSLLLISCICLTTVLPAASQTKQRFSATVDGGKSYQKTIGPGLVFALDVELGVQGDASWRLAVKPSPASDTNFADCVTYPLHGPTVLDLDAWAWSPGADPAWKDSREFDFVLNSVANKKACAEMDRIVEQDRAGRDPAGLRHYKDPPMGHARITIRSVDLKPVAADGKARFAKISFDAEITLPPHQHVIKTPTTADGQN